jgi:acyl carrier protein
MTRDEIQKVIFEEVDNIAPGSIPPNLDPTADMREVMDLDSMDMLNLLTAIHARLGVNIPDADQVKLTTLKGALDYLEERVK